MQTVWQDLRFALRILAKAPGFTVTAVISLALGIGINTLVFSLINAVNFKTVTGIKEPAQLVWFRAPASYPDYEDFRERNEVFAGITALSGANAISLNSSGQSEIV